MLGQEIAHLLATVAGAGLQLHRKFRNCQPRVACHRYNQDGGIGGIEEVRVLHDHSGPELVGLWRMGILRRIEWFAAPIDGDGLSSRQLHIPPFNGTSLIKGLGAPAWPSHQGRPALLEPPRCAQPRPCSGSGCAHAANPSRRSCCSPAPDFCRHAAGGARKTEFRASERLVRQGSWRQRDSQQRRVPLNGSKFQIRSDQQRWSGSC